MSPRSTLLVAPLATAMLVVLSACSASGAASTSAGGAAASAAGSAVASAPAAAPTAASGPLDACALVPVATAAAIMGLPYVTAETKGQGGDSSECDYDTKGISLDHLTLMVERSGGKEDSSDDQQAIVFLGGKPIPLSGLGDAAYEAPEDSDARIEKAFGALWGDTYVTVGGPVRISEAQARRLLTAAHDAL